MGQLRLRYHWWNPVVPGSDGITLAEDCNLVISLARVVLVNALATPAGRRKGYELIRLEARLLASMLIGTDKGTRRGMLRRSGAFEGASLHIKNFVITSAGLGLLTAGTEALIATRLFPHNVSDFDVLRSGAGTGNARPDLRFKVLDGDLIGEAKGRRRTTGPKTKERVACLDRLHRWATETGETGSPLLLSWSAITPTGVVVDFYFTRPGQPVPPWEPKEEAWVVEPEAIDGDRNALPLASRPEQQIVELRESAVRNLEGLVPERARAAADEATPEDADQREHAEYDDRWFEDDGPPGEQHELLGTTARGEWIPLELQRSDATLFIGVLEEPAAPHVLAALNERQRRSLEERQIPPLDLAAHGSLLIAVARDPAMATWEALEQAVPRS